MAARAQHAGDSMPVKQKVDILGLGLGRSISSTISCGCRLERQSSSPLNEMRFPSEFRPLLALVVCQLAHLAEIKFSLLICTREINEMMFLTDCGTRERR